MYRRYTDNNCGRTQPIMGTWSCRRDDWCDREEDERDWYDREEDERDRRDWCDRKKSKKGCKCWCDCEKDDKCHKDKCHHKKDENDNNIYINTDICIEQEANATGGDGGDGGEAEGGDVAYATGGLVNVAINEVEIEADIEFPIPGLDAAQAEEIQTRQVPETNTGAQGGNANANGGDGGNAAATNVAEVTVENVIIITGNSHQPIPLINLGSNGRNMDIKIDKEGNAFVNGKKLDAQELGDGSRVLVYRENNVKKEEKKK